MTIEAIAALQSAQLATPVVAPTFASSAPPDTFDKMVDMVRGMSSQMVSNQESLQSLALGETDDLHRVIMNLESTKLAFDLALQVRNKVLDAYQELMRMQI